MDHNPMLLLEILLHPAMAQPSGMRIYADGLYRFMEADDEWCDVWQYSAEEMAVLIEAIENADIPSLDMQYEPQFLVSDGTTTIWRITYKEQLYQITLAPGAQVPTLDKLFHTFSTLRKLSPETSHWLVWQPDGTYREFTVIGSVNAIDTLRPLITAMFVPQSAPDENTSQIPTNTLLVRTDWLMADNTEQTRLYSNGQYVREVDGSVEEEKHLEKNQVQHLIRSIASIDWSSLPDQIDAT